MAKRIKVAEPVAEQTAPHVARPVAVASANPDKAARIPTGWAAGFTSPQSGEDAPPFIRRSEDPIADMLDTRGCVEGFVFEDGRFVDIVGRRHKFSRYYFGCSVLVDVFSKDNTVVRDEIADKRAQISAWNQGHAEQALGYIPVLPDQQVTHGDALRALAGEVLDVPQPASV